MADEFLSPDLALLLYEKGYGGSSAFYSDDEAFVWNRDNCIVVKNPDYDPEFPFSSETMTIPLPHVTKPMVRKWLLEKHNILLVVDYEYECDTTPYYYKLFRVDENGKPQPSPVYGTWYDKEGNPHEEIMYHRDYERSAGDYHTYDEAEDEGIKYCLNQI